MKFIEKDNYSKITPRIYLHVSDLDISSSYPSITVFSNISRTTSRGELLSVSGIPKEKFMINNMNAVTGSINAVEYCTEMLGMPTIENLLDEI